MIDIMMLSFISAISEAFIWSLVSISTRLLVLLWVRELSFSSSVVLW